MGDEESGYAQGVVYKEKMKTETVMGELCEERFGGSRREWRTRALVGGAAAGGGDGRKQEQ